MSSGGKSVMVVDFPEGEIGVCELDIVGWVSVIENSGVGSGVLFFLAVVNADE